MSIITQSATEKTIWSYLKEATGNNYGTAALMGNMYAESGLKPNNLENSYESKLGMSDTTYTEATDRGWYQGFITDSAGYGLCQWTYYTRKENLLNFVRSKGKSIADTETQLEFLVKELKESYSTVWKALTNATNIYDASTTVLTKFEIPQDQSTSVKTKRAGYGQEYYDTYVGIVSTPPTSTDNTTSTVSESQLRQKVVSVAQSLIGKKESDNSFKTIIDTYNSIKPLPQGYLLKYTDAWCAGFVSAVAQLTGLTDIIYPECSCDRMIKLYSAKGRWQETDSYRPQIGDIIMYDWQDNGIGDNVGSADHVGIVSSVVNNTITVIEGNISDSVGTRTLQVNGQFIRGYCLPNYASKATTSSSSSTTNSTTTGTSSTTTVKISAAIPRLTKGATGYSVRVLQLILKDQDYDLGLYGVDSDFGGATYEAVKSFQRDQGMTATGIVDKATWEKLIIG